MDSELASPPIDRARRDSEPGGTSRPSISAKSGRTRKARDRARHRAQGRAANVERVDLGGAARRRCETLSALSRMSSVSLSRRARGQRLGIVETRAADASGSRMTAATSPVPRAGRDRLRRRPRRSALPSRRRARSIRKSGLPMRAQRQRAPGAAARDRRRATSRSSSMKASAPCRRRPRLSRRSRFEASPTAPTSLRSLDIQPKPIGCVTRSCLNSLLDRDGRAHEVARVAPCCTVSGRKASISEVSASPP